MDNIFQDIGPYLFWIIAGLTAGSAIMTVVSQNIVRAATWLLFALGGTAGLFFLLGADFVGAIQLLVYVGGTLVLVIFGVMLTAQSPFIAMKAGPAEWALSIVVGLALYVALAVSALTPALARNSTLAAEFVKSNAKVVADHAPKKNLSKDSASSGYTDIIGRALLGGGAGPAHKVNPPQYMKDEKGNNVEKVERTAYLLPFEIVSVHLLVVLIGAAYLARAKRKRTSGKTSD